MQNALDTSRDTYIFICSNKRARGKACGSEKTESYYEYLRQLLNNKRSWLLQSRIIKVNKTGCLGRCGLGPNLVIFPENIWYTYRNFFDLDEIINEHIIKGVIVERLQIKI